MDDHHDTMPPATHRRRLHGGVMLGLVALTLVLVLLLGGIGGATVHGHGFAAPPLDVASTWPG